MTTLAVILWRLLRRDFTAGLAFAVFLWVSMTTFLRIDLPGALPELTLHRLLLLVVLMAWLRNHRLSEIRNIPLAGCFAFWVLANLFSLLGTQIDFVTSLKRFLDFVLELFLFYLIISTSLTTREDVRRVLVGAWYGLLLVAALAVIERYTRFNPVDRFIPGYVRDAVAMRDTLSTYQHRILLGTAMAMGVLLTFLLSRWNTSKATAFRMMWPSILLFVAACYFSFSRGPWISLIIGLACVAIIGSNVVRKKLALIGCLALLALVLRPGVLDTLGGFASDTVDKDSFKGGTFQYRLELWRVAFNEVSKSPWRLLCGYGPGAGREMGLEWEISYRGKRQVIESWDNHFAYALFQSGLLGLIATLLLYFRAIGPSWQVWKRSALQDRDISACLLAIAIVEVFMMTNVLIFAKQIDYLFWTVVASGVVISKVLYPARSLSIKSVAMWQTQSNRAAPIEVGIIEQKAGENV